MYDEIEISCVNLRLVYVRDERITFVYANSDRRVLVDFSSHRQALRTFRSNQFIADEGSVYVKNVYQVQITDGQMWSKL